MNRLAHTLVFLAVAVPLAAQDVKKDPGGDVDGDANSPPVQHQLSEEEAAKKAELGEVATIGGPKNANLVTVHVASKPRRLNPGGDGVVSLVVVLHSPVVIPAGTGVALELDPEQGPLRFGSYQVLPPKEGTLKTRFRGQMVYDNTVTIEVPVAVESKAEFGKVQVRGSLVSNLTHGQTGQAVGELRHTFTGQVEIGRPLPTPGGVAPAARASSGSASYSRTASTDAPADVEPGDAARSETTSRGGRVVGAGDGPAMGTFSATGNDGVMLEVVPPSDVRLDGGRTYRGTVRVAVPAGASLLAAVAGQPLLHLDADGPVQVTLDRPLADGGSGAIELPVTVAVDEGARGMCEVTAVLDYRLAGEGVDAELTRTLRASARMTVGQEAVGSSSGLFYLAGLGLAAILLLVVVAAIRRK